MDSPCPTRLPSDAVVLALDGIHKHFDTGGARVEVLRGVSLRVAAGESVAVTGPSGSGKTTLLHLAAGVEVPDAGTVRVQSAELVALSAEDRAAIRRQCVGLVFQQHHLLPQLNALENVLLPVLATQARAGDDDLARARQLLKSVGLAERADHRPGQLSGGERQRVAVARALVNRPALLLADEPTAALDRTTAREIALLLARLARETRTALLVATHDPELAGVLDRTATLRDGRLEEGAPPKR